MIGNSVGRRIVRPASGGRVRRPRRRRGLVLGAGGVLGGAWMTGALAALQDRLPDPVGDFDMMVGTSAGSVLVAALRCGFTVEDMVAHQRGGPAGPLGVLGSPDLGYGALPPWPRPGVGSPRLLLAALRAPWRMNPGVVASACLPQGRAGNAGLRAMVEGLTAHAVPGSVGAAADWASPGRTWIVAVDYDTGQRAVFGRAGAPRACLPDAVAASCAIPGWFRPAVIAGRRYVDGGVWSATSADLLTEAGLDEVYVLAPTASLVTGRPRTPLERAERAVRRWMTFALRREVARLRSAGVKVTVLTPGPEDLHAIGANLMDPGRRHDVFETSLRTSARSVADAMSGMGAAATGLFRTPMGSAARPAATLSEDSMSSDLYAELNDASTTALEIIRRQRAGDVRGIVDLVGTYSEGGKGLILGAMASVINHALAAFDDLARSHGESLRGDDVLEAIAVGLQPPGPGLGHD